jgi:flagellar hook-associated protein 1 FlgK
MDMAKATLPEYGSIHIGAKDYKYSSFEYNGTDKYTFRIEPDSLTSLPLSGVNVAIGYANSYQGIPYYMAQMNEWIRNFSDSVNKIMTTGFTSDSLEGVNLLTASIGRDTSSQYSYEQLTTTSKNKGYYVISGGNFTVNKVLIDSAERLATKADITEGESEFLNLSKLKDMLDTDKLYRGATSGEFLTKILADVSLNKSNSETMEQTYVSLEKTIKNQRLSDSGVDEDEEASNLVKFQNAYTLSSKMIQTLTEIYNRLILETGV